jgi:hypothetical protein
MRPHATRRFDWAQLAMGACALLLPPLALGAAFYSMLDDGTTRPSEAVLSIDPPAAPVGLPATGLPAAAVSPPVGQPPASLPAEGMARDQASMQGAPVQGAPVQGAPVQVVTVPAVAVNPPWSATEGAASLSPAESAAAPPPRRAISHRPQRQQPQQQQDPVKALLQQIGILPPYH